MTDETPSVEEIKARLKGEEVPVEEEPVKESQKGDVDVVAELKSLGRQFAETLQTAWNSEERVRFETEVRQGMQSFVGEVDRVFQEARESKPVEKVREEAVEIKGRFETSDIGGRTRHGVAQGLHWMSEELGKLAAKFTPVEKAPPAEETAADSE